MKYKSHALAIRKFGVYLEKSVFEQLKWAIQYLGVEEYWKEKKSPLTLIYKPTGASIFFMGADDPSKIKSIKTADMPITDLWVEEGAEFKTEEELTVIVNSIVRAELPKGLEYKIFYSYNPPKRRTHWLNKKYETQFIMPNTYIHHSTYKDNHYLSKQLLEEITHTETTNYKRYEWEYLGKPTGSGVVPFENLTFRKINDDEIKTFDNIRQGIDWGYGVDPVCFGRMHYDKTRKKLFIFGEVYGVKISNSALAEKIKAKGWNDAEIIADSAEPKSVDEMREQRGINRIKGAKKGAGSVEYGEKWLDDLEEIVIDPVRCPNIAREFEGIDYETDKDGNPKARLSGLDNHSIDMVRYALEDDMKNNKWGF
jgi:PBSX family phage terminase large subunit